MHATVFFIYAGIVAFTSLNPSGGRGLDNLDKVVHLLVYYIFAVLAYRMLGDKRHYLLLCLGVIAYGGLLELGQSFVPGRDMSGYDLLANTIGVVLGALVVTRKKGRELSG